MQYRLYHPEYALEASHWLLAVHPAAVVLLYRRRVSVEAEEYALG